MLSFVIVFAPYSLGWILIIPIFFLLSTASFAVVYFGISNASYPSAPKMFLFKEAAEIKRNLAKSYLDAMEQEPPQANLWACSGSGRRPSAWNSAIRMVSNSRYPKAFLVTNFTFVLSPSTTPDEYSFLARK
jgi:hypothetical protein